MGLRGKTGMMTRTDSPFYSRIMRICFAPGISRKYFFLHKTFSFSANFALISSSYIS